MSRSEQIMLTNKYKNVFQSVGLIGLMGLLLWLLLRSLFGGNPLVYILLFGGLALLLNPGVSHRLILRVRGATPLTAWNAPELVGDFNHLAQRAGLPHLPNLYLLPSMEMNAFSFGSRETSAVVITRGLWEYLSREEMEGVMAHELSHIKNNDLLILQLARGAVWLTSSLSLFGGIMLFFSLPFLLAGHPALPFTAVLLMLVSPTLSRLLWLALSRTREFQADLSAAHLTGNPGALASALYKIRYRPFSLFGHIFVQRQPGEEEMEKNSTHPAIMERIRRLKAYEPESGSPGYFKSNRPWYLS